MTARLPDGAAPYKRTATFDETNVPAALLNDHSTKDGTWGVLRVERGRLRYFVTDPRRPASDTIVTPDAPAIIEPNILHRVEPLGPVAFHVEFHRVA